MVRRLQGSIPALKLNREIREIKKNNKKQAPDDTGGLELHIK